MRKKAKKWYSLERNNGNWIVWLNKLEERSGGVRGIFKGTKEQCLEYCKENKIKVRR